MNESKINKLLILVFFLIVIILNHMFGYIGHYGFDDMLYARISSNLLNGVVDYNDHFTFRFPIILLTTLSYKIFGINDFASAFPALLIALFTLIVVFSIVKEYGVKVITISLSVTTLTN